VYRLVDPKHAGLLLKVKELVKVELKQTIDATRWKPETGFLVVSRFRGAAI
jgi:hypothetical protein